jgi:hypothetical protein
MGIYALEITRSFTRVPADVFLAGGRQPEIPTSLWWCVGPESMQQRSVRNPQIKKPFGQCRQDEVVRRG